MKSAFASLKPYRAVVALLAVLTVPAGFATAGELAPEHRFLEKLFPETPIQSVRDAPLPGFLEMRVGSDIFYVSSDGKYLVQGDVYDIDTKLNLTENSKADTRKAYATRFGDNQSILFAADDPIAEVVVFTDIDCGYCRKLHREIAAYNDKGISIRYLFFPRSGPGSSSWFKAESVWCSEDRTAAMTRAKNNELVESEPCDASVVAEHYAVVNELGLNGTPALLTQDGVLIIGYRDAEELAKIVAAGS